MGLCLFYITEQTEGAQAQAFFKGVCKLGGINKLYISL